MSDTKRLKKMSRISMAYHSAKSGIELMDKHSTGFNKPYRPFDLGLIHGRLLRIADLLQQELGK